MHHNIVLLWLVAGSLVMFALAFYFVRESWRRWRAASPAWAISVLAALMAGGAGGVLLVLAVNQLVAA